jgi:hypothetical protein
VALTSEVPTTGEVPRRARCHDDRRETATHHEGVPRSAGVTHAPVAALVVQRCGHGAVAGRGGRWHRSHAEQRSHGHAVHHTQQRQCGRCRHTRGATAPLQPCDAKQVRHEPGHHRQGSRGVLQCRRRRHGQRRARRREVSGHAAKQRVVCSTSGVAARWQRLCAARAQRPTQRSTVTAAPPCTAITVAAPHAYRVHSVVRRGRGSRTGPSGSRVPCRHSEPPPPEARRRPATPRRTRHARRAW